MAPYRAKKRLGQNFLKTTSVIERITALCEVSVGHTLVEVGPGRGALTRPLAESQANVIAVEFDNDLIGYLTALLGKHDNVKLVHGDFLEFDPTAIDAGSFTLTGNLPYNITSPVIEWIVRYRRRVRRAVLMVQREMARRLAASPGGKDWSPLAIMTQLYFTIQHEFDVGPRHFSPPPRVTSSVITLKPRANEAVVPHPDQFERLVRAAFSQRRKQLVNALVPETVADASALREIVVELGLPPGIRAEQMSTDVFLTLTARLVERKILL